MNMNVEDMPKATKKDVDLWSIGFDFLMPLVLDNVFFKGTKGRVLKIVGTYAAQQALKVLANSKAVDNALDRIEDWLKDEPEMAKPYPTLNEAVDLTRSRKYWNKSRPEDYYDPEREIFK